MNDVRRVADDGAAASRAAHDAEDALLLVGANEGSLRRQIEYGLDRANEGVFEIPLRSSARWALCSPKRTATQSLSCDGDIVEVAFVPVTDAELTILTSSFS